VEDTGLGSIGACTAKCGEWWYDPRPSAVQLQEFYWDETNGQRVLATNLGPALANKDAGNQEDGLPARPRQSPYADDRQQSASAEPPAEPPRTHRPRST